MSIKNHFIAFFYSFMINYDIAIFYVILNYAYFCIILISINLLYYIKHFMMNLLQSISNSLILNETDGKCLDFVIILKSSTYNYDLMMRLMDYFMYFL